MNLKVKKIVKDLQIRNIKEAVSHKRVYRPWGFYLSISEDSRFQVNVINLKPGAKLSLQKSHHRSEHWVVVKGMAEVEINNVRKILSEN